MSSASPAVDFGPKALGLVPSSTSPTVARPGFPSVLWTPPASSFEVDQVQSRLRRMRSGVLTWARVVTQHCGESWRRWRAFFVTLTYRGSESWEPKHISGFLNRLQMWAKRHPKGPFVVPYVWTMELHKSGRPHYHLVLWIPKGVFLPTPDRPSRNRSTGAVTPPMWTFGMSNLLKVRASAVGYISKYVSKGDGAVQFPKGCRLYGTGGLPRDSQAAREARWWRLPTWLRDALPLASGELARRLRKEERALGIRDALGVCVSWVSETARLFASPWRAQWCSVRRRLFIWRIEDGYAY